ncbi:hypothetical protein L1887_57892 [Cichorium endivia]|nr:hypothetical protein L1887_57892 [Cichorium endivia]
MDVLTLDQFIFVRPSVRSLARQIEDERTLRPCDVRWYNPDASIAPRIIWLLLFWPCTCSCSAHPYDGSSDAPPRRVRPSASVFQPLGFEVVRTAFPRIKRRPASASDSAPEPCQGLAAAGQGGRLCSLPEQENAGATVGAT